MFPAEFFTTNPKDFFSALFSTLLVIKIPTVAIIGFFSIMSIMLVFTVISDNQTQDKPQISDLIKSTDSVKINSNQSDNLEVDDSSKSNGENYFIDEDGKKHFTISAQDAPDITR